MRDKCPEHVRRRRGCPICERISSALAESALAAPMGSANLCGRCYDEVSELYPANCAEKPEKLQGAPIGMYHCPDCGAMVLAGLPHPTLCKRCIERIHPEFDSPNDEPSNRTSK